jgi:hypothetical protein
MFGWIDSCQGVIQSQIIKSLKHAKVDPTYLCFSIFAVELECLNHYKIMCIE